MGPSGIGLTDTIARAISCNKLTTCAIKKALFRLMLVSRTVLKVRVDLDIVCTQPSKLIFLFQIYFIDAVIVEVVIMLNALFKYLLANLAI